MKIILPILFISYLNTFICNCQLLGKPSLTVEDFEIALTNAGHLSKILIEHNFVYSATSVYSFNELGTISNPLYPDLSVLRSENWELKNPLDQSVDIVINLLEWEPGHAPQPDIIKTIIILVKKDSKYPDQMKDFLEKVKIKYPN
jgi:hypothetical protein